MDTTSIKTLPDSDCVWIKSMACDNNLILPEKGHRWWTTSLIYDVKGLMMTRIHY